MERSIAETERLIVRTLEPGDIEALAALWRDPIATIEKASGRVVGHCGLLDKEIAGRPEVELVYVIAPSAGGRGYATEAGRAIRDHAMTSLRQERLIALIHPENSASERVAANSASGARARSSASTACGASSHSRRRALRRNVSRETSGEPGKRDSAKQLHALKNRLCLSVT